MTPREPSSATACPSMTTCRSWQRAPRPIVLADFSQYLVRDVRGGVRLQRLDELYAANLQVGFFALSYHDGMWVHAGNVHPARALQMAP